MIKQTILSLLATTLLLFNFSIMQAQIKVVINGDSDSIRTHEELNSAINKLEKERDQLISKETENLKSAIEELYQLKERNILNDAELKVKKEAAALATAKNISDLEESYRLKIDYLKRTEGASLYEKPDRRLPIYDSLSPVYKMGHYKKRRVGLEIGFGYSYLSGNTLDINDFSFGHKNKQFSIGFVHDMELIGKNVRFSYGLLYQNVSLELNGNRVFAVQGNNTVVTPSPRNYEKAKLRLDQLVVPLMVNFSWDKHVDYEGKSYVTEKPFKIGVGGFVGVKIGDRYKYVYREDGKEVRSKDTRNYNFSPFLYGVQAVISYEGIGFFYQYYLNSAFESGSVDGNFGSIGLRLGI